MAPSTPARPTHPHPRQPALQARRGSALAAALRLAACATTFAATTFANAQSPQSPGLQPSPGAGSTQPVDVTVKLDTTHRIPGTVKDLSRDAAGRILYCTFERDVGRIVPGKQAITLLATAANSPFESQLRAVAATPAGDVAVVDAFGHVYRLPAGVGPAVKVYSDLYMISDATDLIVDARGSFLVASATPSSGQRAVNWIQPDGQRWGYYLVKHQPAQLVHDPLTGGIVIADTTAGGNLQLVAAGNAYRTTSALDASTHPGISSFQDDGDLAAEADGDLYWIAGGSVYKHTRATGATTLFASGYGQLRGVVIAASNGWLPSATGWSLYLAEGENPTRLREIPGVDAPGGLIANDQGAVPGKGTKVNVLFGFQVYDLAADNAGRLLVGGSQFGSNHFVKRVTLTGTPSIALVANSASGLSGIVEGLCVAPDDSIYALTRPGAIQRITEAPLTITTIFSDPANQITAGKDLALDVNGTLYAATRESWDFGKILSISGGGASLVRTTEETRGLAANPAGGLLFSQWHNTGFHGTVDLHHFSDGSLEVLPGFAGMNYTNDFVWGDGDICVDALGAIYTISEDDWSLIRYDPDQDGFVRFGSGYLNHPSGLAIAPSTAGSGSVTGWSLYVSEFDNLWEKPSVQAPASTLVDSSFALRVGRTLAAAPRPEFGRPRVLAPAPGGSGVLIGTATGSALVVDPASGAVELLAGPEQGLRGAIAALVPAPRGRRVLALTEAGEVFALQPGRARRLTLDPEVVAAALARALAAPQRTLTLRDPFTRLEATFVLDGWVLWRVTAE